MQKLGPRTRAFFVSAMELMESEGIPYLVGGAYAYRRYTGIERHTRDFDLFLRPADIHPALSAFERAGHRAELTFPHWLGKIYKGRAYVDLIFSSGNGVATVDDRWFEHAVSEEILGHPAQLVPVEEMIWSKAFVMERERYDGADVAHLLLARAETLNWDRVLERFEPHPLVLLTQLTTFAFVFPSHSDRVPEAVWNRLVATLEHERRNARRIGPVCRGTLLSRSQYLTVLQQGFRDARLPPDGSLDPQDLAAWTEAAVEEDRTGVPAARIAESARELRES